MAVISACLVNARRIGKVALGSFFIALVLAPISAHAAEATGLDSLDVDSIAMLVDSFVADNPSIAIENVLVGEASTVETSDMTSAIDVVSWPIYDREKLVAFVYAVRDVDGSTYTLSNSMANQVSAYVGESSRIQIVRTED